MRVYLDSAVIIYRIEGPSFVQERIDRMLLDAAEPSVAVYSDLSRLECRVKPIEQANQALLNDYEVFLATPGFQKYLIDSSTFELATTLRERHRLKTPDALHLASALLSGCEQIWTNDDRLVQAAGTDIQAVSFTIS